MLRAGGVAVVVQDLLLQRDGIGTQPQSGVGSAEGGLQFGPAGRLAGEVGVELLRRNAEDLSDGDGGAVARRVGALEHVGEEGGDGLGLLQRRVLGVAFRRPLRRRSGTFSQWPGPGFALRLPDRLPGADAGPAMSTVATAAAAVKASLFRRNAFCKR